MPKCENKNVKTEKCKNCQNAKMWNWSIGKIVKTQKCEAGQNAKNMKTVKMQKI